MGTHLRPTCFYGVFLSIAISKTNDLVNIQAVSLLTVSYKTFIYCDKIFKNGGQRKSKLMVPGKLPCSSPESKGPVGLVS